MSKLELKDDFGHRMKAYEAVETERQFDPTLPVYARIDGRSFSRFTRGMDRPFDRRMRAAMTETTKYLVDKTHARMGYSQSDEISLVWEAENRLADGLFFAGKIQKMASVLAGMATAKFMQEVSRRFPFELNGANMYADRLPHFDARVIQMPSRYETANMILWRAMDARKNAISAVAQSLYSPKELHGCDQGRMLRMIADKGLDFESYEPWLKEGVFVRRVVVDRMLTDAELARIPEERRPTEPVPRGVIKVLDMPRFNKVINRNEVIFDGHDPVTHEDHDAAL